MIHKAWWCWPVLLSGCAYWPSAEHRSLTSATVSDSLAQQQQQQTEQLSQQWQQACSGWQQQLNSLSEQLQQLQVAPVPESAPAATPQPCLVAEPEQAEQGDKVIVGAVEWLYLPALAQYLPGRIDSGATTSSLSATQMTPFERNEERWIRFTVTHDEIGGAVELEAPVVRYVRIRQASSDELERRAVVNLTVSLGKALRQDTEFTLTDRRDMDYPLLLGREFLRDVTLIDVAQEFIHPKPPVNKAGSVEGESSE